MKCREEDKEIEAFRCKLDPAYHSTYSYSRKPIHCDIIRKLLTKSGLRPKSDFTSTPKAILVTGPIGAGKSYLLSWMQQCALVPSMKSYVMVNMDEIRDMLPESKFYSTCLPEEYGEMTQREAGTIAELLVLVALGRGFNVCIDSAMIDLQWQEEYIMQLRQAHPDIKIAMIHVTASKDVIEARIKQRNAHGHRFVPSSIMRSYFQQVRVVLLYHQLCRPERTESVATANIVA